MHLSLSLALQDRFHHPSLTLMRREKRAEARICLLQLQRQWLQEDTGEAEGNATSLPVEEEAAPQEALGRWRVAVGP